MELLPSSDDICLLTIRLMNSLIFGFNVEYAGFRQFGEVIRILVRNA